MQLRPEELGRQLAKGLAPVYLIAGEEPLFVEESLDAVRAAAREAGFSEREVLDVESGFDWGRLAEAGASLSLFGERRLIELRMPTGKPGAPGSRAISAYCAAPAPDVVLLISCGALEAGQRRSAWVSAADKAGVFLYAWPLPPAKLPAWVSTRLRTSGLSAPEEAVALLAERAEGNLLAAAQEVEKLRLLYGEGALQLEQVAAAVADSSRFTIYNLADAALEGSLARSLRMLRGLRAEGVEPVLVLWSLARDLRVLAQLAGGTTPAGEVFSRARVFKQRQARLQNAARRASASHWQALLGRAARADRVIKGQAQGRAWDELVNLTASMARAAARVA